MRVLVLGLMLCAMQAFADICEDHFARKSREVSKAQTPQWAHENFVSERIMPGDGYFPLGSRNLIIINTAHKVTSELSEYELAELKAFENEYMIFLNQKAKLEYMLNKSSVESCRRAYKKEGFDYEAFVALANRLSAQTEGRSFVEGKAMRKLINEVAPELRLTWEIVQGRSDAELYYILSDPNLRHVVMISHGDDNGTLRDYLGSPISFATLSALGANIESLSFFSCHSADAMNIYGIREHFLALPSNGRARRIFYVKPEVSIMNWFGRFIRMVEANLV